jgi:signal peptidase
VSRRRIVNVAATVATFAAVLAWCVLLRPTMLGGPGSYVLVAGQSMEPGLHTGDLAFLLRQDAYQAGDVIAYRIPADEPGAGALVIHRVLGGSAATGYRTQGDNRDRPDFWRPTPSQIRGRMRVTLPHVGTVFAVARQPLVLATLCAAIAFSMFGGSSRPAPAGG